MKKIIYTILCCLVFGISYAAVVKYQEVAVGSIVKAQEVAIGSVVDIEEVESNCTLAYFSDVTVDENLRIANTTTAHYVGTVYTPAATQCICQVDVYVSDLQGTLTSSFDFYMQIYTVDGNDDLAALVSNGTSGIVPGESIVDDTWISANAGNFTFATAPSLTGSTEYALVIVLDTEGDGIADEPNYSVPDDTNYFSIGYDNGAAGDAVLGGRGRWLWDSSIPYADQSTDADDDVQIKVYTETCP